MTNNCFRTFYESLLDLYPESDDRYRATEMLNTEQPELNNLDTAVNLDHINSWPVLLAVEHETSKFNMGCLAKFIRSFILDT